MIVLQTSKLFKVILQTVTKEQTVIKKRISFNLDKKECRKADENLTVFLTIKKHSCINKLACMRRNVTNFDLKNIFISLLFKVSCSWELVIRAIYSYINSRFYFDSMEFDV